MADLLITHSGLANKYGDSTISEDDARNIINSLSPDVDAQAVIDNIKESKPDALWNGFDPTLETFLRYLDGDGNGQVTKAEIYDVFESDGSVESGSDGEIEEADDHSHGGFFIGTHDEGNGLHTHSE